MTQGARTMDRRIALCADIPADVSSVARTIRERGEEVFAGACAELAEPVDLVVAPLLESTDQPSARWTVSWTPEAREPKLPTFCGELWAHRRDAGTQLNLHGVYSLSPDTYGSPTGRLRGHLLACDAFELFLREVAQRIVDAPRSPEERGSRFQRPERAQWARADPGLPSR